MTRRVYPRLRRQRERNRVRRVAARAGRLDEEQALGTLTTSALRLARSYALEGGSTRDDVDHVTMGGLVEGREARHADP